MKRHLVERELTPEGPRHRPAGPGGACAGALGDG